MKNILNSMVRRIKQNPVQSLTLIALDLACWLGMIYFTVYAFTLSLSLGLFMILSYGILMFFVVNSIAQMRKMSRMIIALSMHSADTCNCGCDACEPEEDEDENEESID